MQPEEFITKRIQSLEALFWLQVREIVFDKSKWSDCVQEARIKVWQILVNQPEATSEYLGTAARNRIREVSQFNMATGNAGQQGTPMDPLRRNDTAYFGTPDDLRGNVIKLLKSGISEEDTEAKAAIRVRVSAAVEQLSTAQQDYIHQRFYARIPAEKVTRSGRCWYAKERGARSRLSEELEDLAA